jgi:hypothetical protein
MRIMGTVVSHQTNWLPRGMRPKPDYTSSDQDRSLRRPSQLRRNKKKRKTGKKVSQSRLLRLEHRASS